MAKAETKWLDDAPEADWLDQAPDAATPAPKPASPAQPAPTGILGRLSQAAGSLDELPWWAKAAAAAAYPGAALSMVTSRPIARGIADAIEAPGSAAEKLNAGVHGAEQGATFGWGDEIGAGIGAAAPPLAKVDTDRDQVEAALAGTKTIGDRYRALLSFYRGRNAQAKAAHPGIFDATEIAGAMALPGFGAAKGVASEAAPLGMKLLKGAASGAAQGAAMGSGLADDDKLKAGLAGAAIGAPLGAGGAAVGEGLSAVARKAGTKVEAAEQRAAQQAAEEKAEQIAQASGAYGSEVQKGSRLLENVLREAPNMTPAEQQRLADLLTNGDVDALRRQVISSTLDRLPGQAQAATSAKSALDQTVKDWVTKEAERKAQLLEPSFGKDAASLVKSYGEPLLADAAFGPGAGIVMGRTRAGKAIALRFNRPGNQKAIWDAIGGLAGRAGGIGGRVGPAGGAVAAGTLSPELLQAAGLGPRADLPLLSEALRRDLEDQP